ncbi:MAG TPA: phosphatase PAP2 family protein [Actinomycetes bacterium]|jgi:membrane-associated phospholipid phosphatase|nr:phosphatase PAP2 family protein [Actinomycetes bacterium]
MLPVDRALVESLNRIAQHQPLRLAALVAATYLVVVPIAILLAVAVMALRRRDTHRLAVAILAGLGAAGALGLNQLAGHLYFRLRPYWGLPAVHAIGSRGGDSSFFSDHATLAAAATVGVLLVNRRWGLTCLAVALLVGVGRVAVGAHYPSDVLVGLVVGGLAVMALLPLRQWLQRLLGRLLRAPGAPSGVRPREWRLGVIGLLLLVGFGGWLVARVQDHGLRIALNRADGRLNHRLPTDARLYRPATIDLLAAGRWRPTRARVYGQVTYVNREFDGDIHVVLKAPDGSFVVLEIIPELPIPAPHDDDRITAWGIVRHDGLHNWWELHPLIGWAKGQITAPSTGGLDD